MRFSFNAETAVNNTFQSANDDDAQETALREFNDLVSILREHEIDVTVIDDTPEPYTPDSIFPNNWISFHGDGRVVLYPMYASNRRLERKPHVLEKLKSKFLITDQIDLTAFEDENIFLEGTGSMVLDRDVKVAYACISPRTHVTVLNDFCLRLGFTPLPFEAADTNGVPVYHTNVMMCVADQFVVICLDAIKSDVERKAVVDSIIDSKKELINISFDQMNHFAGNMLQVKNSLGEKFLVMSSQAYRSLDDGQILKLEKHNAIIHSALDTIERNGGGSARCMIAEIFLPARS